MAAHTAICVRRLFIANLDRMLTPRSGSGFSHELRVAALLERHEPEDGLHQVSSRTPTPITLALPLQ